jgi:hypothetical protein
MLTQPLIICGSAHVSARILRLVLAAVSTSSPWVWAVRQLLQAALASLMVSACLCGRDIAGDAGFDGGGLHDAGVDGGPDLDAGADAGDAGIDCSRTCSIAGTTYCAHQLDPVDSCYMCDPDGSVNDWTPLPIDVVCRVVRVAPGDGPLGACEFEGGGSTTEYCSCATSGSGCRAPTDCCQGVCQDAGNRPYCAAGEGYPCSVAPGLVIPCFTGGTCCVGPDGGSNGVCILDGGACPH